MGEAPWRNRHRTVGSPEKAGLACKNGCDQVIEYRKEDFGARMKEITNREGCQVVYEGVGQATFPASLDCLRRFGKFVSFASASRPIEAFDIMLLAEKGRSSPSGRCCPCISPGARTFLP